MIGLRRRMLDFPMVQPIGPDDHVGLNEFHKFPTYITFTTGLRGARFMGGHYRKSWLTGLWRGRPAQQNQPADNACTFHHPGQSQFRWNIVVIRHRVTSTDLILYCPPPPLPLYCWGWCHRPSRYKYRQRMLELLSLQPKSWHENSVWWNCSHHKCILTVPCFPFSPSFI